MNNHRLDLHEKLCEILGNRNVFFQPPETLKIPNRAIIYRMSDMDQKRANNKLYSKTNRYQILFCTPNPDETVYDDILEEFEMSTLERSYRYENLNYYSISLFY